MVFGMGAFFTNVQLRLDDDAGLARLVSLFTAKVSELGYGLASEGEAADRTISFARSGSWIAVYDEATDSHAVPLAELAAMLSRELSAPAITVSVHDSDVLDLELWEAGERRDVYSSAPSYFDEPSDEQLRAVAGKPAAWRSLLARGRTEEELRSAFTKELSFAEDTLREIAELLGLDPSLVSVGYRYAAEGHGPRLAASLRFRLNERPSFEIRAEGKPALGPRIGASEDDPAAHYELMVGSPAQLALTLRNGGGAARGLELTLEGSALESGIVGIVSANLVLGEPRLGNTFDAAVVAEREGNRVRYVATFPDAEIPAAFAGDPYETMRARPDKVVEIMFTSNVHANVHLEARREGEGEVVATFVPTAAPETAFSVRSRVTVAPRAARPLRATEGLHPHQLAPLLGRDRLFLLVSFDSSRDEAARFAAAEALRWSDVLGDPAKLEYATFHRDPRLRPSTGHGFALAKLEATFRETQVFSLSSNIVGETLTPAGPGAGLAFGTRILPPDEGPDAPRPTFALWTDGAGNRSRALEERLVAIADRAMTTARGIQAIVGRWSWAPSHPDRTPYEEASGVHGGTLERTWLVRYVRGVAPGHLWLGRELAARIDRDRVAAVAEVAACGEGIRVRVDDSAAAIAALEGAIEPILPDENAWREAQRGGA